MNLRHSLNILLGLCLTTQVLAAGAPAAVERAAIRQARLAQNAAIARHDLNSIAAFWTDDVTLCRGLGAQLAGKAAYLKLFADDDPTAKDVIVYQRIPTAIETGSQWPLAFETGRWQGHLGSSTGPVVVGGRYSAQWVKRADHWLIRSEVYVALSAAGVGKQMQPVP